MIRGRHGKVTGQKTAFPFNRKDTPVRYLQVNSSGAKQLAKLMRSAGEDFCPQKGAHVVVLDFDEALLLAIATDDNVTPSVDPGERMMYSYDELGNILARVHAKKNGKIEISNTTQNLKTTLSGLVSNLQTFCISCAASTDPTLAAAAFALNGALASVTTQLGVLLE